MKTIRLQVFIAMFYLSFPEFFSAALAGCPPAGYDLAALNKLEKRHFEIADVQERQTFARNLLACLRVPDATLRDRIAYKAYANWRHNKSLDATTWQFLESSLLATLDTSKPDPDGVIKSFAALVLAEAMKADRAAPYLSEGERQLLLNATTNYLISLRDYRGFDSDVGWRHGVAHAADLLAQLALSPSFGKTEMDRILVAVVAQIVPADTHFYVYGEEERLAMAVVAVASRDVYTADEWNAWLIKIVSSTPFGSWDDVYGSQPGLAKLHDTKSFLLALYAQTSTDNRLAVSQLAPIAVKVMQPLG